MKIINNKKAQGFNEIYAIVYLVFIVVLMVSIVFLVRTSISLVVDTSSTELSTYYNAILYSEDNIFYYDYDIGRSYHGRIDMARFKSSKLDSMLNFVDVSERTELPSAKLTLINNDTEEGDVIYWNEDWFTRLDIKSGFSGVGSPNKLDKTIPIVINGEHNGLLRIEIVVPR